MHRTVYVGMLKMQYAEVNGTKKNRCIQGAYFDLWTAKEPSKENTLLGSQTRFIGVLSDDFAAVDFREELCYSKPPEKAKFGGLFE